MDRNPIIAAHELRRVVIDLTPVLPGGENGGAKIMTLELIRHLAQAAPGCRFFLLTSGQNHQELAALDAPNVSRVRIDNPGPMLSPSQNLVIRLRAALRRAVPASMLKRLASLYHRSLGQMPRGMSLLHSLEADLLFCPFTALNFYDPSVPVVSVVYDLQYRYYPEFFDPADLQERDRSFRDACLKASYIVSISQYVRKTILENAAVVPERIETIPILLPHRLQRPSPATMEEVLRSLGLRADAFLLYPANFWRHKNHERLLEAFRTYLASHGADIKLVLTGAPSQRRDLMIDACRQDPVLCRAVVFPGYLPEREFSALLYGCQAMILPSLFEGFGMPLLEAMAARKPLLISNTTSLPEVAGDAAVYFDPMRPDDIANAIERFERDPDLQRSLAEQAGNRLQAFGGPGEMTARYLQVFRAAIGAAIGSTKSATLLHDQQQH